jgi:hypothetical protein
MAISTKIGQELADIATMPEAKELTQAINGLFNLAAAKASGSFTSGINRHAGIMIATDNLADAEKLAAVYASALQDAGYTKGKINTLEWETVFTPKNGEDENSAMYTNVRQAFADAKGGMLLVREPNKGPAGKSDLDQQLANYSATAELLYQMDKDEGFNEMFDDLRGKGKTNGEIEQAMFGKNFEPQGLPVVIVIGTKQDLRPMYEKEPSPWNMRFQQRIGLEDKDANGWAIRKPRYGF